MSDAEAARETGHPGRDRPLERVIGANVRRHRLGSGRSVAELAARLGLSKAMVSKIENAQISCSLSTINRLADGLEVPVTALFRDATTSSEAVFVPAGYGARIVREDAGAGHEYELLGALRGPHKRMEALLVTLTEPNEIFPRFEHPGTELIYMLDGSMVYGHGDLRYTLRPGDAVQFDGEGPHGPEELLDLPIRFLSVTAYGDSPSGGH